jgi:P pilus assembly chaperone PapD
MGNGIEIDIRKGGTVDGASFTWKNGNPNQTTADNFTPNYLTLSSYPVKGHSNGKDGEMGADVVTGANGTCDYNWGDQITGTTGNGSLKINNSGKP